MLWWTLRQLTADDWRAREGAAKKLGGLRDARAIEGLVSALKDKNSHVRQAAESALIAIGQPSVRPLISALKKHPDLRQAAKETLVRIGPASVAALGLALFEKDLGVRETAAAALGRIGDTPALEQLLAALKHGDFGVKEAAAAGLVRVGKTAVKSLIGALKENKSRVRDTAAAALVRIGSAAIEPLIGVLDDSEVRDIALEALSKIDPHWPRCKPAKGALPTFVKALTAPDDRLRRAAANILGEIGDSGAIEPLIAAAADPDETVRDAAIASLGNLGDPRALVPLVGLLRHREAKSRGAAAAALVRIGRALVEPLIHSLTDRDPHVREAAAAVLVRIGHSAVEPLAEALWQIDPQFARPEITGQPPGHFIATAKQESAQLHRATKEGLKRAGEMRVLKQPQTQGSAKPWNPALAAGAQKANEGGSRIKPLPLAGEARNETSSLAGLRDVETLSAGLDHADPQVRASAIKNLLQLGHATDQPLVAALKNLNAPARRAAAHALASSGDLRACEALRADLNENSDFVVMDAAESLVRLGDPNVISPLLHILQRLYDSDPAEDSARHYKAERVLRLLHRLLEGHAKELLPEDLISLVDFPKKEKARFIASTESGNGEQIASDQSPNPNILPGSGGAIDCSELRELARRELLRRKLRS